MAVTKNGMVLPFILEIILSHIIPSSYLQFLSFSSAHMKSVSFTKLFQEKTDRSYFRVDYLRHQRFALFYPY